MSKLTFFKDKVLFLFINFILFVIVAMVMAVVGISMSIILIVFFIWFTPLITYIFVDMIKHKKFYDEITLILDGLEKKYLLPAVLQEPNFIQGKIFANVLEEISKDMHENVKYYRDMQEEYREYIETWVHEVKTPIASAKLMVENYPSDVINKIDIQLDRIEGFVEQALYYSRSEDVSKDYIIKELDLSIVIKKVIKRNIRDFINKKIKLELQNIQCKVVYSDMKWSEFIINQIIINAIKYAKPKEAIIRIYSEEKENSVALIIEDNGVGISDKDIPRVFEKGFTGENGRLFGKSTGIGLYLCKNLCNKLGLEIDIESELGKGTRVVIIFPCSNFNNL
ncbi:MAG: sensor histidine kinase [Cellulosilyticaceae bacterium]